MAHIHQIHAAELGIVREGEEDPLFDQYLAAQNLGQLVELIKRADMLATCTDGVYDMIEDTYAELGKLLLLVQPD